MERAGVLLLVIFHVPPTEADFTTSLKSVDCQSSVFRLHSHSNAETSSITTALSESLSLNFLTTVLIRLWWWWRPSSVVADQQSP